MTVPELPWTRTVGTGVGSLPGTDPYEAVRLALGETPGLAYLPELPGRGAGADLVGRSAALLTDLPVELQPSGWRLAAHGGRDLQRARDFLARDLDALEELAGGHDGPVKVQCAGPWTLAASLELTYGDKALADHGAVADLTDSLADGLTAHLAEVAKRLPHAQVVLQLDEPSLPAVLAAQVRTASGFGTLRSVDVQVARDRLRTVIGEHPTLVHCCAGEPPVRLLVEAGAAGVGLDVLAVAKLAARTRDSLDAELAEAVEDGVVAVLGVLAGTDAALSDLADTVGVAQEQWHRLGLSAELLATRAVLSPSCGLAGASPPYARAALQRCRVAATRLSEEA